MTQHEADVVTKLSSHPVAESIRAPRRARPVSRSARPRW